MGREDRASYLLSCKKEAIRLLKRLNTLRAQSRSKWVELPKPERNGWKRFFIVRPDVLKSPLGPKIQRLLDTYLQDTVHSRRKDFLRRDYKTGKWVEIEQSIRHITPKQFAALILSEQAFFVRMVIRKKGWRGDVQTEEVYVYKRPYHFNLKIKPDYITHRLVVQEQVESEIAELDSRYYGERMWRYLDQSSTPHDPYSNNPDRLIAELQEKEGAQWRSEL